MLYIFDLGNVMIDIDFNRVIGVWSNLSGVPLSTLSEKFRINSPVFEQYERGEVTDDEFAQSTCYQLEIGLSMEQFVTGWQAIFDDTRQDTLNIMQRLRNHGEKVVMLSNTNALHYQYLSEVYPQLFTSVDHAYLSQQLGMRKPDAAIFQHVLDQMNVAAEQAVFFDDIKENIMAATNIGINSVLVEDSHTVPDYFARQ